MNVISRTPALFKWIQRIKVWFAMPDNPSTELALIKLLSDQLADVRALSSRMEHFGERLGRLEHQTQHRHQDIMTALQTLLDAIAAAALAQTELTTAVNAAIVLIGTPGATDAQILSAAQAIAANTASDVALTAALNAALNPPPPVVVP